jgi:1-acyl-sn-glycerol-3-phosphate acyltransferase
MTFVFSVVTTTIRGLTRALCRVDDAQLARVPERGPLIIVANHVNFLDVPLLFTHLLPRNVTGFAKAETWDSPLLGPLFSLWGAIPLHRGQADVAAFRRAERALAQGHILAMAPEGTRSAVGRLQRGHPGVVTLALRSGAPLLPVGYYGGEAFWPNVRRLARTDFHIVVGQPFRLRAKGVVRGPLRQQITDEIMYQLAALLPHAYRGYYADLNQASAEHLSFVSGTPSKRAPAWAAPARV